MKLENELGEIRISSDVFTTITGSAAAICGLGDRVGRIAPGLDGDILIFDRDPVGLLVRPEHILVDGKQLR